MRNVAAMLILSTPFVKETEPLFDELLSKIDKFAEQWEKAEERGDDKRMEFLAPQKAWLQARTAIMKARLDLIDE